MKNNYTKAKTKRNNQIVKLIESGMSYGQLAKKYNVTRGRIAYIYKRSKKLDTK